MQSLTALANLIRYKLSGEGYHHHPFRLGMTMTLDPTPFILGGAALKATSPAASGGTMTDVAAVGTLEAGSVGMTRLYLGDGDGFLQLWLDGKGTLAECRYFSRLDQETPPDEAGWDVWLNDEQGIIGWPQFQTLDGKLYDRVWSPGASRIEPKEIKERIETPNGVLSRRLQAMLYAASTGTAEPAPQFEYILVAAVEENDSAWVDIHAGIDLNPAALQLG